MAAHLPAERWAAFRRRDRPRAELRPGDRAAALPRPERAWETAPVSRQARVAVQDDRAAAAAVCQRPEQAAATRSEQEPA